MANGHGYDALHSYTSTKSQHSFYFLGRDFLNTSNMKKPNEVERDDAFWLNAKSPCCGKQLNHELTTMLSKPYQKWVCVSCGNGWNNTITDTWNYHSGSSVGQAKKPRERINFHDLCDVAKKLPRGGKK